MRNAPATVCLGPDVVQIDTRPLAIAQVRAEWKTYQLPGDALVVEPHDQTLANAPTRLSTSGPVHRTLPPRTILGHAVRLQLTSVARVWVFGDGATARTPVTAGGASTVHAYRAAGEMAPHVETEYTATFTLDGAGELYPLDGTGVGVGPAAPLLVREARSQLEQGTG